MWQGCWDPCFSSSSTASVWPAGTVLDLRFAIHYVTKVLGPLVFPFKYCQCLAGSTVLDLRCDKCDGVLGSLVFLFMYRQCLACRYFYWSKLWHTVYDGSAVLDLRCDMCDGVAGTPVFPLHLPPVSCLQVLNLIYSVTYVAGVLGPLFFLVIYCKCLVCRYFTWSKVWHTLCEKGGGTPGIPLQVPPVSGLQVQYLISGVTNVMGSWDP